MDESPPDTSTVSYPTEEAEKYRRKAEKELLIVLLAYQAGELSRASAVAAADIIILKLYREIIEDVNTFYEGYGFSGGLQPEDSRLRENLDKLRAEFVRALDTSSEFYKTPRGADHAAELLGIWLVYALLSTLTFNAALTSGDYLLRWRTQGDDAVCEACRELEGVLFDPTEPIPAWPGQLHWGCRCFFQLIRKEDAV